MRHPKKNMKRHAHLLIAALSIAIFALLSPASFAQQKDKILPIFADEGTKVRAIKDDPSFSRMQKTQRIKAIHQQNDPQMKAILSPEQYQKLQTIRQQTIREATQTRFQ